MGAFERDVEWALDSLPEPLRTRMDNVVVLIEREDEDEPDLYGLYVGTPLTERTSEGYAGSTPDAVLIYRRPLEADFGHDRDLLRREIRTTVLHELAHHFGIDDRELERLGWA